MIDLEKHWYKKHLTWLTILLLPLSWLYLMISIFRRHLLQAKNNILFDVPVIIVGNINIGGVGKSPLVSAMVKRLRMEGYTPGVVSRGYGGESKTYPLVVDKNTLVECSGDEPKMLFEQITCPFVVDPNRTQAVAYLLQKFPQVNVLISDDGLQHYKLHRDLEIVVIDAKRQFGNKQIIPAGPLRESMSRLKKVDLLIANGEKIAGYHTMFLKPKRLVNVLDQHKFKDLSFLADKEIHAVTGIGNPQRFFDTLEKLGAQVIEHPFPDHHKFMASDLCFEVNAPIIMTHKDAVKCNEFNHDNLYYLEIMADIDDKFFDILLNKLEITKGIDKCLHKK